MDNLLRDLEPGKVFYYFEQISKIPRGSRNTKAISDYCVNFAKEKGFKYYQDESNNVIIIKEATSGRESDKGVIIQGHLDMVTEKKPGAAHDFLKEGIKLYVEGDFLHGTDTTLGGDDGIAVAYAFAILDSDDISHPRLEVILTVDEEIGMLGAAKIDLSMIKGKYLLNIDSDEEGILTCGCAGGMTSTCKLPISTVELTGQRVKIKVSGLKGGHSGAEIHKQRANADILLGRILYQLSEKMDFCLENIAGGFKDNAIPREAEAVIVINKGDILSVNETVNKFNSIFKTEFKVPDKDIHVAYEELDNKENSVICKEDTDKIIFFLMNSPNGVMYHDGDLPELIETSLNLGILRQEDGEVDFVFAVRSSVKERKTALSDRLSSLIKYLGGSYETTGVYPEWKFNPDSVLLKTMSEIYLKMFEKKPEITTIHAGLECGYMLEKCPDLDIVSFGPDNYDIHTTEERLSISSVQKMYDYIIEILKVLH